MKMCSSSSSSVVSVSLCLLLCLPPCLSSDDYTIRAEPGQSVSLPCRAPSNTDIVAVEWTRAELEPGYVLKYRSQNIDPDNQHPSYQNRVELKDREMKDGDVSMILKEVTKDDSGTYECRVVRRDKSRSSKLISIVHLEVHQSGDTEERGDKEGGDEGGGDKGLHVGLGVGLTAAALLVVGGALIFRRNLRKYYQAVRNGLTS